MPPITAEEKQKGLEPQSIEPTAEQLAAAKDAYAKHGAKYIANFDPAMKRVFLTNHVFSMRKATDADLKGLPNLPFYFALSFVGSKVTDKGLQELKHLKNLTSLTLDETKVGDEGMTATKEMTNLRRLAVKYTKVTDVGLKELKELTNLKELALGNSQNVQTPLGFSETPVTDAGVEELQRALPNCHIGR